jgi:formate--tetrahydrofolate ligase
MEKKKGKIAAPRIAGSAASLSLHRERDISLVLRLSSSAIPSLREWRGRPLTVEISQTSQRLLPIAEIARKLDLQRNEYEPQGPVSAKLSLELLSDSARPPRGKLILVTATTPTASGEGKTVTSIGLVQGMVRIGRKAVITSREPSLGPVFGMKGGAAGGGQSQIEPSQKINLHFHGDLHAITAAHNLLAALVDSHLFHDNDLDLDPEHIWWPRALDMNDRALRSIRIDIDGKRAGANRRTGFVITAASEIMAILALARDRADLRPDWKRSSSALRAPANRFVPAISRPRAR